MSISNNNKNNRRRWIIGGLVALAILIGAGAFFASRRAQTAAEPASVGEVVTAFVGDLEAQATSTGTVNSRREASLSVASPARVEEVFVRVGDTVQAGMPLMQLDTSSLALDLQTAEQNLALSEINLAGLLEQPGAMEVAAAEAAVAAARAAHDELMAGPSEAEIASAEANLRSAQASISSASADLNNTRDSVTDSQIQAAQAALLSARLQQEAAQDANEKNTNFETDQALQRANQQLAAAQAQLDVLLAGPDQGQLAAAQGGVSSAAARAESSQAALDQLLRGPTAAQIAASEAQLAQAEASLATLVQEPSAEEIAAAEADVEQARLAVANAQQALDRATVTAPFAGAVTQVSVNAGEYASGVVSGIVDLETVEVLLEVDEVDVAGLAVGQPVQVTLVAWPDDPITAVVRAITPGANTSPGSTLVNFEVRLDLGDTDLPLLAGMTADAVITTNSLENVLLLPNEAINADRSAGTFSVNLQNGESTEVVAVTIGLRDGRYTQILSGLQDGDQVVVGPIESTNPFGDGPPPPGGF